MFAETHLVREDWFHFSLPELHFFPLVEMTIETRRSQILDSIEKGRWDLLRDISVLPGGLEAARTEAWWDL